MNLTHISQTKHLLGDMIVTNMQKCNQNQLYSQNIQLCNQVVVAIELVYAKLATKTQQKKVRRQLHQFLRLQREKPCVIMFISLHALALLCLDHECTPAYLYKPSCIIYNFASHGNPHTCIDFSHIAFYTQLALHCFYMLITLVDMMNPNNSQLGHGRKNWRNGEKLMASICYH